MSKLNLNSLTIDFGTDTPADVPATPAAAPAPSRPAAPDRADVCFMSLGSGSSGNCAYLGTRHSGILIDAGVNPKEAMGELERNGVDASKVVGIILTHDHQDHVRYIYAWLRLLRQAQVFCTPRLMSGMLRKHCVQRRIRDYHRPIYKETPFRVAGMEITAFETSHDASDNMGFSIETARGRFVVMTDTGVVTARARHYLQGVAHLMIESDYDPAMLAASRYPEMVKDRIRSPHGHLTNEAAAACVAEIYHPGLRHVFLCHLSKDNNSPELATEVMTEALTACRVPLAPHAPAAASSSAAASAEDVATRPVTVGDGTYAVDQRDRDVQVYPLPRYDSSLWFVL